MGAVSEALMLALERQQLGRFQEAEQIYKQVLAIEPTSVDAWHLLGVLAFQTGRLIEAVNWISRALQLMPSHAEARFNLGNVLVGKGGWMTRLSAIARHFN